ncbi:MULTISPECIES: hypothetical protein [unclassified Streptomyces]|uniref:aromatic-ring hydroxylase C-terminal domain-containing protein n=1 Tax=unclassified Streptomyces TaxID=2593676 RepID=UPI00386706C9
MRYRCTVGASHATMGALGALGDRKDRLTVESWASDRRTTLLVRPDGYVAWAAESPDAAAVAAAVTAAVGD